MKADYYTSVAQIIPVLFIVFAFEQNRLRQLKEMRSISLAIFSLVPFIAAEVLVLHILYTGTTSQLTDSWLLLLLSSIGLVILFPVVGEALLDKYGIKVMPVLFFSGLIILVIEAVFSLSLSFSVGALMMVGAITGWAVGALLPPAIITKYLRKFPKFFKKRR